MDIQFYGANCISLGNKQSRIVIDDNLAALGKKSVTKNTDTALFTGAHGDMDTRPQLLIDSPGEYEVSNVSIYGIPARAHMEEAASKKDATIYKFIVDDMRIVVTGHIYPELNERQLEDIGTIDIMIVPVGGSGYTLDAIGALKLIKKIEPKIVIPTHYASKDLNYEVPQAELSDALKELGMEAGEPLESLKFKNLDLGEGTRLVILKEQ